VKEKPVPEAPEMTDNFLFEFAVPEKNVDNFKGYLYPVMEIFLGDVSKWITPLARICNPCV
jgi:hypothetical protein